MNTGNRKLTYEDAQAIRKAYGAGSRLKDLGAQYGIGESMASLIVNNKRYIDPLIPKPDEEVYVYAGQRYVYRPSNPVFTLYGTTVKRASLRPHGMTMTLCNVRGETLSLRGELIGEVIVFIHLVGEGGTYEIGRWIPIGKDMQP